MNLAWSIARRYLIAKKSHNLINVISWVSFTGVAVGTLGLIVVLSVFNGFGKLVLEMYNSFDPDIRITLIEGKRFLPEEAGAKKIAQIPGVEAVCQVIEENALLRYRDRQYIATLKGVEARQLSLNGVKSHLIDGTDMLEHGGVPFLIAGGQIAWTLGLRVLDPIYRVTVFVPKKGLKPADALLDPSAAFAQNSISVSGVFSIQQDFDSKYALVPIDFIRGLTGEDSTVTAIEIMLKPDADAAAVQQQIMQLSGSNFAVKDRYQQHDFLYKILKSEKAAVYIILGFILMIATFNLFGTLSILIVDKKKDIQILANLGADDSLIRRIFLYEGLLVSVGGALAGLLVGSLCCLAQMQWGFIGLEQGSGMEELAYPVSMQASDFVMVLLLVCSIGFVAAYYTSGKLVRTK